MEKWDLAHAGKILKHESEMAGEQGQGAGVAEGRI